MGKHLKVEEGCLDSNNNNSQLYLVNNNNNHNSNQQVYLVLQLLLLNLLDNNREVYLDRHLNNHNRLDLDLDNNKLQLLLVGHLFLVNNNLNNKFKLVLDLELD